MADEKKAERLDVEPIRRLLELMKEHDLVELEMEQEGLAVRLRKAGSEVRLVPAPAPPPATPQAAVPAKGAAEETATIKAPMVGTFYVAPEPGSKPFVEVGDHVTEDTVACVIEAMKVFNDIRAEMSGTIEKVLVKNGQAVEFGQPLFVVRPD
ncbi:MAG: acetyl-CoA carboxylase biotin carboxyl carrier protein [Phycisphaerae bacterium]